jgi:DNA-binding response OmpR family regulator
VVEVEAGMTETRPLAILLVEDNPADAELVREALKEHEIDCSLRVLSDGAQAIAFINRIDTDPEAPPLDLLLLDVCLPKCDGEEVLKCLRSSYRYANTPVIITTGLSSSSVEEEASRYDGITYFQKPCTLEEFMQLGSIMRRVLERGTASPADQRNCGRADYCEGAA